MSKRISQVVMPNHTYRVVRCDCLVALGGGSMYFVQSDDDRSRVLSVSTSRNLAAEVCGGLNSVSSLIEALNERHDLLSDAREFMLNSHREATYSLTAAEVEKLEKLKRSIYAALQTTTVGADVVVGHCGGSHLNSESTKESTRAEKAINDFANIIRRVAGR